MFSFSDENVPRVPLPRSEPRASAPARPSPTIYPIVEGTLDVVPSCSAPRNQQQEKECAVNGAAEVLHVCLAHPGSNVQLGASASLKVASDRSRNRHAPIVFESHARSQGRKVVGTPIFTTDLPSHRREKSPWAYFVLRPQPNAGSGGERSWKLERVFEVVQLALEPIKGLRAMDPEERMSYVKTSAEGDSEAIGGDYATAVDEASPTSPSSPTRAPVSPPMPTSPLGEEPSTKKRRTEQPPSTQHEFPPADAMAPPQPMSPLVITREDVRRACAVVARKYKMQSAPKGNVLKEAVQALSDFEKYKSHVDTEKQKEWVRIAKTECLRMLEEMGCGMDAALVTFP